MADFVFRVEKKATDYQFRLWTGGNEVTVDWGNGITQSYNGDPVICSMDYTNFRDLYDQWNISISGVFQWFSFYSASRPTDKTWTVEVIDWGDNTAFIDPTGNTTDAWFYINANLVRVAAPNQIISVTGQLAEAFVQCEKLERVGWNFDTSAVTSVTWLFSGCRELYDLEILTPFDFSSCTDLEGMFYGCETLHQLDVSKWSVGHIQRFNHMFKNCYSLTALEVGNWDMGSATHIFDMFNGARNLQKLDCGNWNTTNVITADSFVRLDPGQKLDFDISGWNVVNFQDASVITGNVVMPVDWFDNVIRAWSLQPLTGSNITFALGDGMIYSDTDAAAIIEQHFNVVGNNRWAEYVPCEIHGVVARGKRIKGHSITLEPNFVSYMYPPSQTNNLRANRMTQDHATWSWEVEFNGGGYSTEHIIGADKKTPIINLVENGIMAVRVTATEASAYPVTYTTTLDVDDMLVKNLEIKIDGMQSGVSDAQIYGDAGWENINEIWVKEGGEIVKRWSRT